MPGDVVEDEPLAQRQVAERELGGAKAAKNLVDENGARHREVGAPRFEARHSEALFEIERRQRPAGRGGLLRRDPAIAQGTSSRDRPRLRDRRRGSGWCLTCR